jgi:hypothetical protein
MKICNWCHPDLLIVQKTVYEPSGLVCKDFVQEAESQEYGACTFVVNGRCVKFRVAKITPTKVGQFVTLWKRVECGPIMPHDMTDSVDLFVISVRDGQSFGQFVFPKNVLYEKGFVSKQGQGGKRAMRVYPPWDTVDNHQAKQTQLWQLHYFLEISANNCVDIVAVQKLFG